MSRAYKIITKIITLSVIATLFIIFGLRYMESGVIGLFIIGALTFEYFPIACLVWLIDSIVKYIKARKNDNNERKELKNNLIWAVIVSVIELINIVVLGKMLITIFSGIH